MKIRTCGSSPRSASRNAWTRIKNDNGVSRLNKFWNFFGVIQMISCHDWWPWTKPGYITMTRRQSKNQYSGGVWAHPAPKYFEYKNPLEKFSPRFFGIKAPFSSLIIFQRAKLSTRSITHLCWCKWRTFWRENAAESHRGGLVLAWQCPFLPGTCNPEETGLPWLPVSYHPPYSSDLAPSDYHLFPGLKKTIERSPFFVWHRGHCCCGELLRRTKFWNLLSGLQKLEQRAKKCIVFRGEDVEWIPSLVAVAFYLPGQAKEVDGGIFEHLLWTVTNLSFLSIRFVI